MKSRTRAVPRASNAGVTGITSCVGAAIARSLSDMIPTLITPARFIFIIWPTILSCDLCASTAEKGTVIKNASPERTKGNALLSQYNLSALPPSNIAANWWIAASSNAAGATPPLDSFLIIPLVPLSGSATGDGVFNLRNRIILLDAIGATLEMGFMKGFGDTSMFAIQALFTAYISVCVCGIYEAIYDVKWMVGMEMVGYLPYAAFLWVFLRFSCGPWHLTQVINREFVSFRNVLQ